MADLPHDLYAHTPGDGSNQWHDLRHHLRAVSAMASSFGDKFGFPNLCATLGMSHDLAKADPRFQAYLKAARAGKHLKKCPHAAPSGLAVEKELNLYIAAILGHHRGLYDTADAKQAMDYADAGAVQHARLLFDEVGSEVKPIERPNDLNSLTCEMLIRMVFSALVDADYLDTERHFSPNTAQLRTPSSTPTQLATRLEDHLTSFVNSTGRVNSARAEISAACQTAASKNRGAFKLCVPTGGGKTLASMTFALEHAKVHGIDRVIVAIPFTSIIDQTADVYRAIFGADNILEHHSAVPVPEDADEDGDRRKLASENWNAPIIVTTTVQFFESLFANRTAPCRKLHNIARSVIILDEVQTLPPNLLEPILDGLGQLVDRYSCSLVFCTATQPDFSGLKGKLSEKCLKLLTEAQDIVAEPEKHFEALRRVEYVIEPQPQSADDVAETIQSEEQILCVLNTRKDAIKILDACADRRGLAHLSTLMCPHHRKKCLDGIRQKLRNGERVRLVSTQVVEAGVDIDFPIVMRDLGPLDRVVQAAGRCNREGALNGLGKCVVFALEGGAKPQGSYATACAVSRILLDEHPDDFDTPAVLREYFRRFYQDTETDPKQIQKLRAGLNFETVAREFKMIESETEPLFALRYTPNDDPEELERFLDSYQPWQPLPWFRKAQQFSVSVYKVEANRLRRDGLIQDHPSGLAIFGGVYSDLYGIGGGGTPDPSDLII